MLKVFSRNPIKSLRLLKMGGVPLHQSFKCCGFEHCFNMWSPTEWLDELLSVCLLQWAESHPPLQRMGTAEATLRMDSMEVKDEWQDEDFPRYLFAQYERIALSSCAHFARFVHRLAQTVSWRKVSHVGAFWGLRESRCVLSVTL